MEIWLDSTCPISASKAFQMGFLHGVTTNPTLVRQSGKSIEVIVEHLLKAQKGPVTMQVTHDAAEEMLRQAEAWCSISSRLVIKVPATQEGYKAMRALGKKGVAVMATVIFHPHQVLLAALAGATYAAPYIGRMEKAGIQSFEMLETMLELLAKYRLPTKILAASLPSLEHITQCARLGTAAITLKEPLFETFFQDNPHTRACLPM